MQKTTAPDPHGATTPAPALIDEKERGWQAFWKEAITLVVRSLPPGLKEHLKPTGFAKTTRECS